MATDFYSSVAKSAGIDKNSSVLVICGGPYDKTVMQQLGLTDVVISNLAHHAGVVSSYEPYQWMLQDAENLTLADDSFDWAVVHAGLHHVSSPHKALCEMLRVARRGILVIEARDSLLMRLATRLGLTRDFELEPALLSGSDSSTQIGGHRNSHIPNYVYRWTEREVVKTVYSYLPQYIHAFSFFYGLSLPLERMTMSTNIAKRALVYALSSVGWVLENVAPKQGNQFAFVIGKKQQLQPWLTESNGKLEVNLNYLRRDYDPAKYQKNRSV